MSKVDAVMELLDDASHDDRAEVAVRLLYDLVGPGFATAAGDNCNLRLRFCGVCDQYVPVRDDCDECLLCGQPTRAGRRRS